MAHARQDSPSGSLFQKVPIVCIPWNSSPVFSAAICAVNEVGEVLDHSFCSGPHFKEQNALQELVAVTIWEYM